MVEHEEDPGSARRWPPPGSRAVRGPPLRGRARLDVTRDPMPEDWRGALRELGRLSPTAWQERHGVTSRREQDRRIYAVTGATISSRASPTACARRSSASGSAGSGSPYLQLNRARPRDERTPSSHPAAPGAIALLKNGIFGENPVFRLALSLCPAVAVTTTVANGIMLGIAVLLVQVLSASRWRSRAGGSAARAHSRVHDHHRRLGERDRHGAGRLLPAPLRAGRAYVKLIVAFAIIISRLGSLPRACR